MNKKNFSTPQITANTTPQLFVQNTNYAGGQGTVKFLSLGANACFIGNSNTVSASSGFPLSNTQYVEVPVSANIYIMCVAGTCNVAALVIT